MKKLNIILLILAMSYSLFAQVEKPVHLKGDNVNIVLDSKKGITHPSVFDWNKDGKKDLIVGEFQRESFFRVYLNVGTDSDPKFTNNYFYGIKADGTKLSVTTG